MCTYDQALPARRLIFQSFPISRPLLLRTKPPHSQSFKVWILIYLDIIYQEPLTAWSEGGNTGDVAVASAHLKSLPSFLVRHWMKNVLFFVNTFFFYLETISPNLLGLVCSYQNKNTYPAVFYIHIITLKLPCNAAGSPTFPV